MHSGLSPVRSTAALLTRPMSLPGCSTLSGKMLEYGWLQQTPHQRVFDARSLSSNPPLRCPQTATCIHTPGCQQGNSNWPAHIVGSDSAMLLPALLSNPSGALNSDTGRLAAVEPAAGTCHCAHLGQQPLRICFFARVEAQLQRVVPVRQAASAMQHAGQPVGVVHEPGLGAISPRLHWCAPVHGGINMHPVRISLPVIPRVSVECRST